MKILSTYCLVLASVFLAALGTVSLLQIGPVSLRPYQLPLFLSAMAFLLRLLLNERNVLLPNNLKVLSFFFIAILVSFWASQFPVVTLKQMILLGVYFVICFLITNTCDTEKKLVLLHKTVIYSCLIVCLYGSYLFFLTNLPGVEKEGGYYYTRPKSFFVEPNEFGLFLTFAFGYIFSELISKRKIIKKPILWVTFMLVIVLVIPNMSRGSWLGLIAVMITAFFCHRNSGTILPGVIKIFVLILISSILFLWIVSPYISVKKDKTLAGIIESRIVLLFNGKDPTFLIRLEHNKNAIRTMLKCPFTGVGFGNAFTVLEGGLRGPESGIAGIPDIGNATSSNFLADIGVETGMTGLASFLLFLIMLFKEGIRKLKMNKVDFNIQIVYIGAFASFMGLLVNGLTYPMLLLPFFWITAGVLNARVTERA